MSFDPHREIEGTETLFRAFQYDQWDFKENRVTSAVFKSSGSVSVDRDGQRTNEEIIAAFRSRNFYENCGLVCNKAEYYRSIDCKLTPDPNPDNIYHALVDRENKEGTSNSIAKKLSRDADLVTQAESN